MKALVSVALLSAFLAACSVTGNDPSMASCAVTVPDTQATVMVNNGYDCGNPEKATSGTSN